MSRLNSDGTPGSRKRGLAHEATPAAVILAFGIVFLIGGLQLPMGSVGRMGPGYFPVTLSVILLAVSALLMLRGWTRRLSESASPDLWAMLLISLSTFGFAGVYLLAGLLPAIAVCVGATMAFDGRNSWKDILFATLFAMLLLWAIFIFLLDLPMPVLRGVV